MESASDPMVRLRGLPMGTRLRITTSAGVVHQGTLVSAHEFSLANVVPLKLASGYNVGIQVNAGTRIEVVGPPEEVAAPSPAGSASPGRKDGPWVTLLTTGGTIASRVDYKTGGVRPVRDEAEILRFYPGLEREGPVRIVPVFDRLSEEIDPNDWLILARRTADAFREGAAGVVIAHGTDTMGFTAAALSFLLENPVGPVVLVGAQRSPDRPSSDGFTNLAQAVRLARHSELAEIVVVMHEGLSDTRFAIHRGTRVRKMHSSRRDAFQTRNGPPLGIIENGRIVFNLPYRTRTSHPMQVAEKIESRAAVLWFYPGLSVEAAKTIAGDLRGIVLAGTGLGHVSSIHLSWIREAVARGVVVAMTTQCLAGSVDPYVYSTGRELLRAGVLYLGDMLPETAYAKLVWALGTSDDPHVVRQRLTEDRAGESETRHPGATAP